MTEFKEALSALGPIDFTSIPTNDSLPDFLKKSISQADLLVQSIPTPPPIDLPNAEDNPFPPPVNSASNAVETLCDSANVPVDLLLPTNEANSKGWGKPIKLGAKENPLKVSVYKMAAHDRHGAWFARRSIHQGMGFAKWKVAMQREFAASLAISGHPGAGAVRGIAADRRVESQEVDGIGKVEVWQTSAAFPSPVTARESLTMILTSDNALELSTETKDKPSRNFMIVSRPTSHDDVSKRPELVKMAYESAELIREIKIPGNDDPEKNPVEWLMITRSDPGGGIPKFLVERGTPASIVGDVSKFLNWACGQTMAELEAIESANDQPVTTTSTPETKDSTPQEPTSPPHARSKSTDPTSTSQPESEPPSYLGTLTAAVGSTVGAYLPFHGASASHDSTQRTLSQADDGSSISSVSSSSGSFASALHRQHTTNSHKGARSPPASLSSSTIVALSAKENPTSHEKEILKIHDKRVALDAKITKEREAYSQKTAAANQKEEKERARAQERHEKEKRKAEERYAREVEKLSARREKEERKVAERRKKEVQKDELGRARVEVREWKEKCEGLESEVAVLKTRVAELETERTGLDARVMTPSKSASDA